MLPDGVVAGVVGSDLVLIDGSTASEGGPCKCWPDHCSYDDDGCVIAMRLDALVGGVGNVCARSSGGRCWGVRDCDTWGI